jgi:hypothetical protein
MAAEPLRLPCFVCRDSGFLGDCFAGSVRLGIILRRFRLMFFWSALSLPLRSRLLNIPSTDLVQNHRALVVGQVAACYVLGPDELVRGG